MPPTVCHFRIQVLTWVGTCGVAFSAVLGVAPSDEARYSGATFTCFSGDGHALPSEVINDGFCDCTDGSDEPGTGACAGQETTLFYCSNEGSTPRRLYASRVGDGICDCCDGSDEAELAARHPNLGREMKQTRTWMGGTSSTPFTCSNTCAEQGKLEQQEKARRIQVLKQGIAKQEEGRQKHIEKRQHREVEIKELESQLPALEEALKQATQLANVEREAEKAAKEAKEAAELKDVVEQCKVTSPQCMWRQTGACNPDGDREADKDQTCFATIQLGASGFCDCDGDGIKGDAEKGYDCDDASRNCCSICAPQTQAASAEAVEPASTSDGEEKPQVSEYSKWMDGAEEKLADKSEEKPQVSEYSKWMDGAEEKLTEDQGKDIKDNIAEEDGGNAETPTEETTTPPPADEPKTKTGIEQEREAQDNVDELKRQVETLRAQTAAIPDEYLGYAGLDGVEISKRDGEFDYKINFFQEAKQDYTSLGSWGGFDGPNEATFKHGTRCWDGPERELKVLFKCDVEAKILDVIEPSKCVYQATVTAPGACTAEELERQSSARVIGPKEEL